MHACVLNDESVENDKKVFLRMNVCMVVLTTETGGDFDVHNDDLRGVLRVLRRREMV